MMNRHTILNLTAWIGCLAALGQTGFAQQAGEGDAELVLEVYDVGDLVFTPPDYPYVGNQLPTTGVMSKPIGGGFGGGGLGGGFGGGGFGGGGFFSVSDNTGVTTLKQFHGGAGAAHGASPTGDQNSNGLRFNVSDLRSAIISTVEPNSWEEVGGPGVCTPLGGMLLIRQTPAIQRKIQELLDSIGRRGGAFRTVTVEAYWLLLGSDQIGRLGQTVNANNDAHRGSSLNRTVLEQLAAEVPGYRARLTCFNGQTVHLVAGHRRTVSTSATPTVGFGATGYTPLTAMPNIGVLLQLTPLLQQNRDSAILDVQSTVTGWTDPGEPIRITSSYSVAKPSSRGSGAPPTNQGPAEVFEGPERNVTVTIDRVNLPTQEWKTTLTLPLGRPVLVGGLSVASDQDLLSASPQEQVKELYLFVELKAD